MATRVRKGQATDILTRDEFRDRYLQRYYDPAFDVERAAVMRLEQIAWCAYRDGRKAPKTAKAGRGFANPDYDLSVEWTETRRTLIAAQKRWKQPGTRSRVLLIAGGSRNDGSCPGEMSKTFRLAQIAKRTIEQTRIKVDLLDLSLVTSEYGRQIHPCKGCVSTAMPLCHWPCSCYPNHAQGQTGDWMNEIYERWAAAHGVLLVTPFIGTKPRAHSS